MLSFFVAWLSSHCVLHICVSQHVLLIWSNLCVSTCASYLENRAPASYLSVSVSLSLIFLKAHEHDHSVFHVFVCVCDPMAGFDCSDVHGRVLGTTIFLVVLRAILCVIN